MNKGARLIFIFVALAIISGVFLIIFGKGYGVKKIFTKSVQVPKVVIPFDKDGDGILDLEDIVEGAKNEVKRKPLYTSVYYDGGYPPFNEGVCTDVIWRALQDAGYNLKDMMDEDIKNNKELYPAVNGKPDPNIDFRRVKNQLVFFKRFGISLTLELKPGDVNNLKQWQGGDIVTFGQPEHVVIISDKRRKDGVPYIIHNGGPYPKEEDALEWWMPSITGHFRFPKE